MGASVDSIQVQIETALRLSLSAPSPPKQAINQSIDRRVSRPGVAPPPAVAVCVPQARGVAPVVPRQQKRASRPAVILIHTEHDSPSCQRGPQTIKDPAAAAAAPPTMNGPHCLSPGWAHTKWEARRRPPPSPLNHTTQEQKNLNQTDPMAAAAKRSSPLRSLQLLPACRWPNQKASEPKGVQCARSTQQQQTQKQETSGEKNNNKQKQG
jgi:hypothetical protein